MHLDDRKIVLNIHFEQTTCKEIFLKGCFYICSFLHDVSTEIETFPNKMEIVLTIQLAFKILGHSTVLLCVWVFFSPKIIKWQPETGQGMGSTSLSLSIT